MYGGETSRLVAQSVWLFSLRAAWLGEGLVINGLLPFINQEIYFWRWSEVWFSIMLNVTKIKATLFKIFHAEYFFYVVNHC